MRAKKINILIAVSAALMVLFSCGSSKHMAAAGNYADISPVDNGYAQENTATYFYSEAVGNIVSGGDPQTSKELLGKALAADPSHGGSLYQMSLLYKNNPDSALYFSRMAFESDTANIWYRTLLARNLLSSNRYDSALMVYRSLVKLAPNNSENYRLLAALYAYRGETFTAISILDSAENVTGISPEISDFKRELLVEAKLYDKAVSEMQELINNFPYEYSGYITLAELYSHIGKDSLALDAYAKSMQLNPDNTEALISMNDFYKKRNDHAGFFSTAKKLFSSDDIALEDKIKFFEDLTASRTYYQANFSNIGELVSILSLQHPRNPRVIELYGGHLIALGQAEEALKIFKTHIRENTYDLKILNSIIDIEAFLQRPDSVEKYTSLALELNPGDIQLYIRKGSVIAYYLKDHKRAGKEYMKALKYADTDSLKSVIYTLLGDNSHSMGKLNQCYTYYERALRYDSLNSLLLNNYAYYLSESDRRLKDAERMALRSNELSENSSPTVLDTYAWVLYKLKRYDEAAKVMRRAISLDNTSNEVLLFHFGEILYAQGDEFMATVYWKRAREHGYNPDEVEARLKMAEK